ncbi:MAG: hypothetical protein JSW65_03390 [Candidatus Bipolaricaulota bacterium]|nr:MAG: hypothetical protein JSW65_03390 [Candidatus Bipolaricaulota bacterium]
MKYRWTVLVLLLAAVVSAAAQPREEPIEFTVRELLVRMADDVATGMFLVKLSVDAAELVMLQWHLSQIEALLLGADEEAASRFGWPRERIRGLLNDAHELTAALSRLPVERPKRDDLVAFAGNVQALMRLTLEEVREARRQRSPALAREHLLRASAYLVASFGLPINAFPGGLYSIAWRLGLTGLLEGVEPLWEMIGEPPPGAP